MPSETLITIDELAARLRVAKGTLYNWAYLRRIPFIKVGRCLRFDYEAVSQTLKRYNGPGWSEDRRVRS